MRVALTRPLEQSEKLAQAVTAMGHAAVIVPVTAVVPLPVELLDATIDAVVVTSAHATAALTAQQRDRLARCPAYAVGAASAAAARACGFADVRVAAGDGAALLDLVRLTQSRPGRLLYLAGAIHKPALPLALAQDGHEVVVATTYDAQPADWTADAIADLSRAPPDAWLHLSRRSAALALSASRRVGLADDFRIARHGCLSEDVAAPLRADDCRDIIVAMRPTTESLLQALGDRVTLRR